MEGVDPRVDPCSPDLLLHHSINGTKHAGPFSHKLFEVPEKLGSPPKYLLAVGGDQDCIVGVQVKHSRNRPTGDSIHPDVW